MPPLSVALSCHRPRNFPVIGLETVPPAGGSPLSQCPTGLRTQCVWGMQVDKQLACLPLRARKMTEVPGGKGGKTMR